MLSTNNKANIARMAAGESLLRIGPIWYGEDRNATVNAFTVFSQKNVETLLPIRAEAAISFSNTKPPVDSIQVELVVDYRNYATHVQRLFAALQVSPVLPVMNTALAALVQPVDLNKRVYEAYGHNVDELTDDAREGRIASEQKLMQVYSSVPIQMRVGPVRLASIDEHPRDLRLMVTLTRVLTANSYGDRVLYAVTTEGARQQNAYLHDVLRQGGDNRQIDAMASILAIPADNIKRIRDEIAAAGTQRDVEPVSAVLDSILDIDLYKFMVGSRPMIVKLHGVETLISSHFLRRAGEAAMRAGTKFAFPASDCVGDAVTVTDLKEIIGTTVELFPMAEPDTYYLWSKVMSARVLSKSGEDIARRLIRLGYAYPAWFDQYDRIYYTDEQTLIAYGGATETGIERRLMLEKRRVTREVTGS